jgi:hypothetical protein
LLTALVGGREAFTAGRGVRVVSDLGGQPLEVVGIDTRPRDFRVERGGTRWQGTVAPNQVIHLEPGGRLREGARVPFHPPPSPGAG